jgi:hypothetical protein
MRPLAEPLYDSTRTIQLAGLTYAAGKILIYQAFYRILVVDVRPFTRPVRQGRAL